MGKCLQAPQESGQTATGRSLAARTGIWLEVTHGAFVQISLAVGAGGVWAQRGKIVLQGLLGASWDSEEQGFGVPEDSETLRSEQGQDCEYTATLRAGTGDARGRLCGRRAVGLESPRAGEGPPE